MTNPSANLLVSVSDETVFLKITGRANFASSVSFKTLISELLDRGHQSFLLDLSECLLMDSTFLGVLAGLGLKLSSEDKPDQPPSVRLLNPNTRIAELLQNLGVDHLFNIGQGEPLSTGGMDERQPGSSPTRRELSQTSLDAHKTLMDINPENIPKFKDVTRFLAEDLKKNQD